MTQEQLCELPIPKWLGRPLYPGGWPLRKESIHFADRSIEEIWRKYLVDTVEKKIEPDKDDVQFLKYYVIYHIHAPVFDSEFSDELRSRVSLEMSLDQITWICMEYGLDPL